MTICTVTWLQLTHLRPLFPFCSAIGIPGTSFTSPDPDYFVSSDEAAGVEAFVKARQGFLFPLPQGLCFLESVSLWHDGCVVTLALSRRVTQVSAH